MRAERNPTAKFRLLACRSRKNGYSIRKMQGTGQGNCAIGTGDAYSTGLFLAIGWSG